MSLLNTKFIASVKAYHGKDSDPAVADKKGLMPVVLVPTSGQCPSKRILAGTIAKNMGIEVGSLYVFTCMETEPDKEYGRQFQFDAPMKAGIEELVNGDKWFGPASIIDVSEPTVGKLADGVTMDEDGNFMKDGQPCNADGVLF